MIKFVLENFDTIFKNKDSLENLDKLILDLAIKGKLVEQNPNDEPASELLKRIKEEKERLIKEKVIKKEKPLPPIEKEEIPFEIPKSWEWVRLGEIGNWGSGSTPNRNNPEYYMKGTIPWLKTGELKDNYINSSEEKITKLALEKNSLRLCKPKDILIAMYGATIGKLGILNIEATTNQACCACTVYEGIYYKFLFYFLLEKREKFKEKGVGGAQPNISKEKIINFLFCLPPLEEQKRIVEKVEKLQELTKKLKEIYILNENNRENLKKSILEEIEKSNSDKKLYNSLELVFNNFDKVIKTKEDIKDIRNLILSLAIKGKLVEQNQNDESASELLKRIKEEKERLIKDKVIKKEKPLPPIEKEEIPFEIPKSWEWVRLGEIGILQTGNTPQTSKNEYYGKDIPFITPADITMKKICYNNRGLSFLGREKGRIASKNSILQVCIGGSIGKVFYTNKEVCFNQQINSITLYLSDYKYIYNVLSSIYFYEKLLKNSNGTATPIINKSSWGNLLVPLPPLEEQKRIVEKVESLMKICDLLEEKINKNENISEKLLESILKYGG
ncbi:MAG: restriction endonuclease subunit S [Fusobacterium perfoetens]|uniref:restriction endonuclease subunit S n=1 Tax=Fusobacterium perfoetens TaxID=852 RepID=UPI0023F3D75C|nr:restriction endonuclease subunit S [Fusobacterium perfoetens]MCI6153388.1 restriction endonuclease subunit S [Fusobacterium perfoetens]MDY3238469.1 restriction endonuclease subunit S [Fusobacterium perfoetens]